MTITNFTININGGRTVGGGAPLSTQYSQFFGFGDSSADTGYFWTHQVSGNASIQSIYNQARAAGGGIPTDPGYQVATSLIAGALGLRADAIGQPGGTNYAASGAMVTGNSIQPFAPSVVQQISSYLTSANGHADAQAVYYITGSGNSIKFAESTISGAANQAAYMESEAHALAQSINQLWQAGARNIILNNVSGGGVLGQTFHATLWSDLEALSINFIVVDTRGLIGQIRTNPSDFGITNIVQPPEVNAQHPYNVADGGSALNPGNLSSWALFASQSVTPAAANTYLWADHEHFSGVGQRIEARYALNVIENARPEIGQVLSAIRFMPDVVSSSSEMTYQWQRHIDGQTQWSDIAGATSNSYTVRAADLGYELRVLATFNRPGQVANAVSPATLSVVNFTPDTDGRNVLYDTSGSDAVSGTAALDVVTYVGNRSVYSVTQSSGTVTVAGSGVDILTGIDRLQFSDGIIAFDTAGNAGDAYRIYQAAFDRTPDRPGLSYWVGQMDDGMPLSQVALNFILSPEFASTYGNINAMSNPQFVNVVYQNVLHRAPDTGGFNYWMNDLANGYPRHFMLAAFSQSAENQANVAAAIQNGILLDLGAFV